MVICFFSTQYLPTPGGVERYTWNLARRCVAAGHRALVVTASLPGLPARERDADGIEIYRLPSWPVMGGRFPVLKPFADADDLWAQGIDFAVIQTRMYTQSVWAARQCKRRGIPALVIDHSTGYMLHGGLAGALGKRMSTRPAAASAAAGSRSTVSPGMSAAGWKRSASRRRADCPTPLTLPSWNGWPTRTTRLTGAGG